MERAVWLPWAWGAGAAACGTLLWLLQPWRQDFRRARLALQRETRLWLVPVLAVVLEILWRQTGAPEVSGRLTVVSGLLTGDSLATALTWIARGDVPAMLLAAAFFANSAGLRTGLRAGMEKVLPPRRLRGLWLAVLASATAALGMPMLWFGAGGEAGRLTGRLMAALWTSTAATMLMCWLTLSFEAAFRPPSRKPKTGRPELAAQLTPRLWPVVAAGAVLFPLLEETAAAALPFLQCAGWLAAALIAWLPLAALKAPASASTKKICGTAMDRWKDGLAPFTGWLAVAGTLLFAFHCLAGWLTGLCAEGSWLRALAAVFFSGARVWLIVWVLGAWIAIQVDRLPTSAKGARSPRRSAPPHE